MLLFTTLRSGAWAAAVRQPTKAARIMILLSNLNHIRPLHSENQVRFGETPKVRAGQAVDARRMRSPESDSLIAAPQK